MTYNIKFLGKCPNCNKSYHSKEAEIIKKYNNLSLVHADCKYCKSSVVLVLTLGTMGIVTTVGVLTDLNKEDLKKFEELIPISADEVLEVCKYLEK